MDEFFNKYYLKAREDGAIIDAFSDGPHRGKETNGYICFGGGGYQLRLTINDVETEENPPLYTMDGIPLYKWNGQAVQPRTETELTADRAVLPSSPPSAEEQLRADVDYVAAMIGVVL